MRHLTVEEQALQKRFQDDVERLQPVVKAETDWAAAFPDRRNPWAGTTLRLRAAREALTAYEDRMQREEFRELINGYEAAVASANSQAGTPERIQAIEAEQRALGGVALMRSGAGIRTSPNPSPQDQLERENAAKWKELERQRIELASQHESPQTTRATQEAERPWLRELGKILDAQRLNAA